MKYRLVRAASAVVALFCVASSGSASTIVQPKSTNLRTQSGSGVTPRVRTQTRLGSTGPLISITGPSGCSSNGGDAFIGNGYENFAGGESRGTGGNYSAVVDGYQNESCDWYTAIGGGYQNTIGGDDSSYYSFIGGGNQSAVEGYASFIGAGFGNTVGKYGQYDSSYASAVVAGGDNTVAAGYSLIGAGGSNTILGTYSSFIGAGVNNTIGGNYSIIGAGESNTINSGDGSTIGGGIQNTVGAQYSTISGGYLNSVTGVQAIVGGGYNNSASGKDTVIPGGADNVASGANSFAAGTYATAANPGSFVWGDASVTKPVTSTASNQFVARAAGGFYLYSSSTLASGVKLAPGSGSWSSLSDRAAKTGIESIDDAQILAKVAALPVSEWSYREQGIGVRHLGPMAQDFRAAFGLGEDEKHISAVDEEGVALAAIKALQAEVAEKDAALTKLEARVDALEAASRKQ
jgi:hypothetical protein